VKIAQTLLPTLHNIEQFTNAGNVVEVLLEDLLQALTDKSISFDNINTNRKETSHLFESSSSPNPVVSVEKDIEVTRRNP
jgi:hypothetical protein